MIRNNIKRIWNKIEQDTKKLAQSLLISFVFVFVIIALYLALVFTGIFNPDYLNVALIFVLVFVTFLSNLNTRDLADNSQKDRKVRNLEKKLEKLYHNLEINIDNLKKMNDNDVYLIMKYKYLASKELKPNLDYFLSKHNKSWGEYLSGTITTTEELSKKLEEAENKINKQVKEDIEKYLIELEKLTT